MFTSYSPAGAARARRPRAGAVVVVEVSRRLCVLSARSTAEPPVRSGSMRRVGDIVRGAADTTAATAWQRRALAAEARAALGKQYPPPSLTAVLQDGAPAQRPSVPASRALSAERRRDRRRSQLRQQPGQHEAPSPECRIALGVMTIPSNVKRRDASRATWMADMTGQRLVVRFLLRALGLPRPLLETLTAEHERKRDLALLPVAGGHGADRLNFVTRGRILTLLGWLRAAPALCPGAEWIAKADDDTYILTADLEAQLSLARQTVPQPSALVGYLTWHNYDVSTWTPKSFSFSYPPPNAVNPHWKRAIQFLAGDASRARSPEEAANLRAGSRCQHCVSYANCSGPFPFPNGALMSLSAPLAVHLSASALIEDDINRIASAWFQASVQHPIFEDIWLGAALHRFLPHVPVAWLQVGDMHFFNGEFDIGRGKDRNSTTVYHNRRIKHVHQHVLEKRRLVVTPGRPQLQCSVPADNSWEASPRRRVYRYAFREMESYRTYFADTGRLNSSSCVFVDDAQLRRDLVVDWPPKRARKPPSGRGGPRYNRGAGRSGPKGTGRGGRGRRRGATKTAVDL